MQSPEATAEPFKSAPFAKQGIRKVPYLPPGLACKMLQAPKARTQELGLSARGRGNRNQSRCLCCRAALLPQYPQRNRSLFPP